MGSTVKKQPALALLGTGYTGRFLFQLATRHYSVFASSRTPTRNLSTIPHTNQIEFDLGRDETWKNIPREAYIIWCFPAVPLEKVRAFMRALGTSPRRIVVLGSTSAYEVGGSQEYPPPWVDESAPIDLTKPRVQGEECLRREHGATVLRVAGIYGPGRNPLEWIRRGRVGPSRKYVNLIHVEDLARICLATLEHGKSGEVYNVSDGTPRTWNDIYDTAHERWGIPLQRPKEDAPAGKRISTTKLRQELGWRIRHPDVYAAIEEIERRKV
jgi:hypothetical protein